MGENLSKIAGTFSNSEATNMAGRELKVVRLMEPELCLHCRFADIANVEMADGRIQRMLYCRRLDCDNWDYSSAEPAKRVEVSSSEADEFDAA